MNQIETENGCISENILKCGDCKKGIKSTFYSRDPPALLFTFVTECLAADKLIIPFKCMNYN